MTMMPNATWLAVAISLAIAAQVSAGEAPQVLMTPFVEAAGATPSAASDFERRLTEKLQGAAHERAVFREAGRSGRLERREAIDVRNLAAAENASFVVVGAWRSRLEGGGGAADVELRSGHSGATAQRYVVDLADDEASVDDEAERVAMLMMQDFDVWEAKTAIPPVDGPAQTEAGASGAKPAGKRGDFLSVSRDEPIEINSEELELKAEGKTKHLIFTEEVSVVQGEMHLFAGRIEAIYPNGASQPDRLDASRNVRVVEGDIEVRCREATYLRNAEIVICRGDALLIQGCDEVRGDEIEFDIANERVKVTGAASVVMRFDLDDAKSCKNTAVAG